MASAKTKTVAGTALAVGAIAALSYIFGLFPAASDFGRSVQATNASAQAAPSAAPGAAVVNPFTLDLTDSQLAAVKVEPVEVRVFHVEKEAVGSIDFNEDMETQVFTPYQGKIIGLFAAIGDDVKKGQKLFTIDSPDLLAAESNLIAAAGVMDLTTRNLARLRELYKSSRRIAARSRAGDLRSADRRRRSASGARLGAHLRQVRRRDRSHCRRSLGGSDPRGAEPDQRPDHGAHCGAGAVRAAGNPPPPYVVADIETMWMLANVVEIDSPAFRVGQEVQVRLSAFPDRVFDGKITTIGATVDPNTRRVLVRSEINDPQHELRSGMFGNFVISIGAPVRFSCSAAPRRRAGRRRHADGLGHRRPPAVHQANRQDRAAARRLPANSRRLAAGRAGRHRRRSFSQQYVDDSGDPMRSPVIRSAGNGGRPC